MGTLWGFLFFLIGKSFLVYLFARFGKLSYLGCSGVFFSVTELAESCDHEEYVEEGGRNWFGGSRWTDDGSGPRAVVWKFGWVERLVRCGLRLLRREFRVQLRFVWQQRVRGGLRQQWWQQRLCGADSPFGLADA